MNDAREEVMEGTPYSLHISIRMRRALQRGRRTHSELHSTRAAGQGDIYVVGISVSKDSRSILYSQKDSDSSNILLVENFR